MNIYLPQSYEAVAELQFLSSTEALLKSGQSSRLLLCINQDALLSGYIFTAGEYNNSVFNQYVKIPEDDWNDAVSIVDEWDMNYIIDKINHIKEVLKWKNKSEEEIENFIYTGHGLFSMLLPNDFEYNYNNIIIIRGVMFSGFLNKSSLGDSHSSIIHKLEKEYGAKITIDFISYYQFLVNHCLKCRGFSIGIEDCIPVKVKDIKNELTKSFMEAQVIEETPENDLDIKERKINNTLNNATSVGQKISKDELHFDNALNAMVVSGAKGSYVNIAQIRSLLGQQNVDGKRIPLTYGDRTLPHYTKGKVLFSDGTIDEEYERKLLFESKGFVSNCFMDGLNPQEFFFHASGGREGIIDTSIKTANSGYIQRKLVKKMEDLVKSYSSGLVVNSKNMVVQFNYENNFDPAKMVRINNSKMSFINIQNLSEKLNTDYEWENKE